MTSSSSPTATQDALALSPKGGAPSPRKALRWSDDLPATSAPGWTQMLEALDPDASDGHHLQLAQLELLLAHFTCPLCRRFLVHEPMLVESCGHCFCESCINKAIEDGCVAMAMQWPWTKMQPSTDTATAKHRATPPTRRRLRFQCPLCQLPAFKWTLVRCPLMAQLWAAITQAIPTLEATLRQLEATVLAAEDCDGEAVECVEEVQTEEENKPSSSGEVPAPSLATQAEAGVLGIGASAVVISDEAMPMVVGSLPANTMDLFAPPEKCELVTAVRVITDDSLPPVLGQLPAAPAVALVPPSTAMEEPPLHLTPSQALRDDWRRSSTLPTAEEEPRSLGSIVDALEMQMHASVPMMELEEVPPPPPSAPPQPGALRHLLYMS